MAPGCSVRRGARRRALQQRGLHRRAIALLFAIFRIQPSPFCLLDEVDAALDELNVNRFTRMLREYAQSTQFILITHNKRSMESANLLYGVTMEEPGVSRLVSIRL